MGFNVQEHLIKVQGGRSYLPVAPRLVWFREEKPEWSIETEFLLMDFEKGRAVCRATIKNEQGRIMAQATKVEDYKGFGDFVEKSETGACGRALAMCGFGTQFIGDDFAEGDRLADSPYPTQGARQGESYGQNQRVNKATDGQKKYLRGLGYKGDLEVLTFDEASKNIERLKNGPQDPAEAAGGYDTSILPAPRPVGQRGAPTRLSEIPADDLEDRFGPD